MQRRSDGTDQLRDEHLAAGQRGQGFHLLRAQDGALKLAASDDGGFLLLLDEVLDGLGRLGGIAMHVGDSGRTGEQFVQALHPGVGRGDLAKGVLDHLEVGIDLAQTSAQVGSLGERQTPVVDEVVDVGRLKVGGDLGYGVDLVLLGHSVSPPSK